jgi:hypothetical protein
MVEGKSCDGGHASKLGAPLCAVVARADALSLHGEQHVRGRRPGAALLAEKYLHAVRSADATPSASG